MQIMLSYILPFIALILVVVFIHEYGHYYFAKRYGVGVTDFSIGFGKEIFGWNDNSGTRWKICWIPLGGYVKFFGDRNVYSQEDHKEILEKIFKAFETLYSPERECRSTGIFFHKLRNYLPKQASLFDPILRNKDQNYELTKKIQEINKSLGSHKITF